MPRSNYPLLIFAGLAAFACIQQIPETGATLGSGPGASGLFAAPGGSADPAGLVAAMAPPEADSRFGQSGMPGRGEPGGAGPFSVRQLTAGRTVVREYLTRSGTVFGVAWSGPAQPDLEPLLGDISASTATQAFRAPGGLKEARLPASNNSLGKRRFREVLASRLVVQRWGHPGALRGRAYDPALLPPGSSSHDIR